MRYANRAQSRANNNPQCRSHKAVAAPRRSIAKRGDARSFYECVQLSRGRRFIYICICYESLLLSWYIEDGIGDGSMRAVEGSKLAREEGIFCIRVVVGDLNVRYLLCFIDCQG